MKSYEKLTRQGKARRLRKLAINALASYELEASDVQLVGLHTNALFRVYAADRTSYMMRIGKPGWRTDTDILSEAMWLQALNRDTDIGAPRPELTQNREFMVWASAEGVSESRRCSLMSWVPGSQLEDRLTEENIYKMGVLFAHLHKYSAGFSPPNGFTQRKMDNIYARGEEDVLFSESCRELFGAADRAVLEQSRNRVYEAFAELYADPAELRVIHNDLWHGNIKIYQGRLRPLDFEDTIWGYPVQDIAMALQDLMEEAEAEEFEALQNTFRQGYESRAQWPERYEGQIDVFRAGRMLWVANYVARFEGKYLQKHIVWLAQAFRKFLDTGHIRK
jgi:Ser/Thr protein kinase RdoA (MazF antagonist)